MLAACAKTPEEWLRDAEHRDPFVRELAVVALRGVPDAQVAHAVATLLRATQDERDSVRARAEESLRVLSPRAIQPLAAALLQGTEAARGRAAALLVDCGAAALPALASALEQPRAVDRLLVARTLGRLGAGAVEPLSGHAESGDTQAMVRAAVGLEQCGAAGEAALAALLARLAERDGEPAPAALFAESDAAVAHVLRTGSALRDATRDALVRGLLVRIARDPTVTWPADALAGIPGAAVSLCRFLGDADDGVRYWAGLGLVTLGNAAVPALEQLERDGDPSQRAAAGAALARIRDQRR